MSAARTGRWAGWVVALTGMILLALVVGGSHAMFSDPETSTGNTLRVINNWYDLAWGYRLPINLNNGGGALSNYQLKISGINTQSLITGGKMHPAGNDIRFSSSDGVTSLSYWIESGLNTTNTVVWVKVASIPTGPSTIYMYYGNPSATPASSGDGTFIFWDSFETFPFSKWTTTSSGGSMTQASSAATNGSFSMNLNDTAANNTFGAYATFTSQSTSFVIEFDTRPAQTNAIWELQATSTTTVGPRLRFNSDATIERAPAGSWGDFSPAVGYAANTWYSFRLDNVNPSGNPNGTFDAYVNGTLRGSTIRFNTNVTSLNRIYFVTATNQQTPDIYIDLVKVRAYAAAEPAVTGFGNEE